MRRLARLAARLPLAFGLLLLVAPAAQAAGSLTVSPAGQSAGGTVTLAGSGFTAAAAVSFTFDGTAIATSPTPVIASSTGTVTGVTIIVPSGASLGSHPIVASDGTNTGSVPLTVDSLSATPAGQSPGGTVTLSGSSMAATSGVTFRLDGSPIATSPATVTTNGSGGLSGVTISVPASAAAGPHALSATDGSGDVATTAFNVDTISVSPSTGATDDPLLVTGAGWPANDEIQAQIGGSTVCQLAANAQGQISGDQSNGCRVPPGLSAGSHAVTANDLTNHSGRATGASFMVPTRPPVAAFTPSSAIVLAGSNVLFDGTQSSDPDGTITSYSWKFGDGGSSTGAQPTHRYLDTGTFTVSLTVVDNLGNVGTVSHQITVIAPPPLQTLILTPVATPAVVTYGPVSTTKSGLVNLGRRGFCPGPGPSCTVTIIATSSALTRAADRARLVHALGTRAPARVGRSVIKIGPNGSAELTFKLSKAALASLRKRGRLALTIKIAIARHAQPTIRTLRLTLVSPRR